MWLGLTVLCCAPQHKVEQLTNEQRTAIDNALQAQGLPGPHSLELSGGWVVATYQISNGAEARPLAERSVLAIREAMLPFKFDGFYRVTVNGPSPGTGLIRRYGSARFTDRLEWESGVN